MAEKKTTTAPTGFGTLGGVFTPCTLTILGVIMFLRFGQVVGNAGVWGALAIVAGSKLITGLTTLSLSSISTNTRVKGGGAYFLISRSLGVEFGGSIGVVFFLAQAISVAMYVVGFTEALVNAFPELGLAPRVLGTLVNFAVFVCVFIGAGWTIKVQYFILAILGLSLAAFFGGAVGAFDPATLKANLAPSYGEGQSFFTMFALFFPAATGIMAGANLSGDLANPGRSIPRGTLAAVAVTGLIYAALAVMLGATSGREALLGDTLVMERVALYSPLIVAGVFAATLSSAIGSMMGAPRILQALAQDRIFMRLRFFARGSGAANEPRRATLLTFLIAESAVLTGDLDVIAPIITMFFMVTYGYLNFATFTEARSRNPSYRPVFKISHWSTALAGAVGCAAVMFLISPLWAAVAIALMALLHWSVARQGRIARWGDARSGGAFERARRSLLRLEEDRYHPKNWRPTVLALSGGAWSRVPLAVYGHWLTGGRGILSLGQIIPGELDDHLHRRAGQERALRKFIAEQELEAFPAVVVAPTFDRGVEALVQCHGIGAFRPNIVVTGWSSDETKQELFLEMLRGFRELDRSVSVVRFAEQPEDPWIPPPGTIDVWWRGRDNGSLMLLMAHMLTLTRAWRGRRIRLLRAISSESGREGAEEHLRGLLEEARIPGVPQVVVSDDFPHALKETSDLAAVIFLGFVPPDAGEELDFADRTEALLSGLGTTILVSSAGEAQVEA